MIDERFINMCSIMRAYIHKHRPEFIPVKYAIYCQLALESGWGTSKLSRDFNNFAGLKDRSDLRLPYGIEVFPVDYKDWEETQNNTPSWGRDLDLRIKNFIDFPTVYFCFLDRDQYKGKEDHLHNPETYIRFLLSRDYCTSFPGAVGDTEEEMVRHSKELYFNKIMEMMTQRTFKELISIIEPPEYL